MVVKSNAVPQGNKTFHLRLYDAVGGTIVRDRADCLIVDNLGSSNRPPELSSVTLLSGAIQDVPFDIPFAALAAATAAADLDCDPVTFRIESITHGMLMKNGTVVLPGQTVVVPGDNLTWRSGTNECGTVDAFTIRAFDGRLFSWREAQVSVRVGQMKSAVLTGLEFQNGDLHLSVFAHPGFMYTLEGNANLANPGGWSSVASTNPPVNRFVFVCPKVAGRQMFYRVKCP